MVIEVQCNVCRPRVVATADKWSHAAMLGAAHEHQPVRGVGVVSREEWNSLSGDYKGRTADGQRAALHLDSDGAILLVPVEVR
jgi:hypothetical protein